MDDVDGGEVNEMQRRSVPEVGPAGWMVAGSLAVAMVLALFLALAPLAAGFGPEPAEPPRPRMRFGPSVGRPTPF